MIGGDVRRPRNPDVRTPKEKRLWEQIRVQLAQQRKERRESSVQMPLGDGNGLPWLSAPEPLPRGFAPDPLRERCECNLSTLLTRREHREFKRQHHRLGRSLTASTVLRIMVCAYLEANRSKDEAGLPFGIDLKALDWRSRRQAA